MRPTRWSRVTNDFATPGTYASRADIHGPKGHHTGVDFGKHMMPLKLIEGLPVRSVTPGFVVISEFNSTMGNWAGVYFSRDDVTITYWHMFRRTVALGQPVDKGQILGYVGNTGNSRGAHLHVQANHGQGFDYHAHINPWRWVGGMHWWSQRRKFYGAE